MLKDIKIENYQDAERYLFEIPKFTNGNPLDATKGFYQYLFSCVIKDFSFEDKVIHIAGTNGKGSVCAYLNQILCLGGKKVGMFTSPHLVTMCERFKINGIDVEKELFVEAFVWVKEQLVIYKKESQIIYEPTFFETLFFMGIYIFWKTDVDMILLETGLGGRLDATNVTKTPLLTIITEIGLDHTQYLGDTIEKIAVEKAGIIKKEVPIIYGAYDKEKEDAAKVIRNCAAEIGALAYCLQKGNFWIENIGENSIDFLVKSRYYDYIRLTVTTTALYQVENASLAVFAIEALKDVWKKNEIEDTISAEIMQRGIKQMHWSARMEEIMPKVYLDGGHNPDGVRAFLETVASQQQFHKQTDKNILLFSAVRDKSYEEMIRMIVDSALFDEIFITEIPGIRGTAVTELRDTFRHYTDDHIRIFEDVQDAFREALAVKGEEDTLYIVGSLYLAGLIKDFLIRL